MRPERSGAYEDGSRRETGQALTQTPTSQGTITQPGGQPALPTMEGPSWDQQMMGYLGLARPIIGAAKALTQPRLGTAGLPNDVWNKYVTNPNWTPTYRDVDPALHYEGRNQALEWEEGMGLEEAEPSALNEALGVAGQVLDKGMAAYNIYRATEGEGTPVGTAQAAGSLLYTGWAPYAAYYQLGAAAGSIAEQQGEKGGEIAGYPTEPLMAAPMSGGRILGSVLGGEADINAEELSYEQSAPERWLLGKEEWNQEKTATAMNPALDPINIVSSVLTGKDSALSNTTAALANPVGAYAKDLVQGELFSNPNSFLTGGLNIFGGGGAPTSLAEAYQMWKQNPESMGAYVQPDAIPYFQWLDTDNNWQNIDQTRWQQPWTSGFSDFNTMVNATPALSSWYGAEASKYAPWNTSGQAITDPEQVAYEQRMWSAAQAP